MINIGAVIIAGLTGAIVFSVFTAMARAMGMTTMSIEKMLGAMFGEGAMATAMGWVGHLLSGIAFAFIYVVLFNTVGVTNGWLVGGIIGVVHGLIAGAIVMPMMSAVHPAITSGKIPAPGFFAINEGKMTPMGMIVGHIIFGSAIGGVYLLII